MVDGAEEEIGRIEDDVEGALVEELILVKAISVCFGCFGRNLRTFLFDPWLKFLSLQLH